MKCKINGSACDGDYYCWGNSECDRIRIFGDCYPECKIKKDELDGKEKESKK